MDDGKGDEGGAWTSGPPPFLSKTYDMVDDPATDAVVSWSATNNSFVVWNPPEFARDLLPKYFKHNNFSSFVRQLNTYGFRKVDPDKWEFANEGFLRGQKHLLKGISRRKPAHGHTHQQQQPAHGQSTSAGVSACVEVGKFGLEEEVERLKRDKNVLMQELVRLRQQQQTTDNQLQTMVQRLQGMEQRQQQMMSFLAKAMQSPGFFAQFVQQNENRRITEANNKKRRIRQEGVSENQHPNSPDGQIVKYQPQINEAAKAMLRQIMKMDASSRLDSSNGKLDAFLLGDGSPASSAIDGGNSSSQISGVTLQEVLPTSGQSAHIPAVSGVPGFDTAVTMSETQSCPHIDDSEKVTAFEFDMGTLLVDAPSISTPRGNVIPPQVPRNLINMPAEDLMESQANGFLDPASFDMNEAVPMDYGLALDTDIDALLDNSSFWDDFLVPSPQGPIAEDIESSSADGKANENDAQEMENGRDKAHMDQLTAQMDLLSSGNPML